MDCNDAAGLEPDQKRQRRELHTLVDLDTVIAAGRAITRGGKKSETISEDRLFRQFFGCGPVVALALFTKINAEEDDQTVPPPLEHVMWSLLFLKTYVTESVMVQMIGLHVAGDEKTLRSILWPMIEKISNLEGSVIVWENRKIGDIGNDCLVSVDGTDFQIEEHGRIFYCHKTKKSGLRYEVALGILSGNIVWVNGPFPCGAWPDIKIFRHSLASFLEQGERVEADNGYIGEAPQYVKCPKSFTNGEEKSAMQKRVRARQETVNRRFKTWGCLGKRFRHDIPKHGDVFRAVAVITELSIQSGEALFDVEYKDDEL